MVTRREKAKWLVKLLKVIVVVYLLLILYQLIGNVYSRLSNTHEIQVPEEWNLIVVNRWNELPEDYEVELTELSNGQMVDSRIYPYLQEMFDATRTEDVYPVVREGYRTAEEQQEILDDKIQRLTNLIPKILDMVDEGRITLLDKKVAKMNAELSQVLRDAGYANAAEFFTELFAVREEKRKYEETCKEWQDE